MTRNSLRLKFAKKTITSNPDKSWTISCAAAQVVPNLLKALAILWDTIFQKICSWSRRSSSHSFQCFPVFYSELLQNTEKLWNTCRTAYEFFEFVWPFCGLALKGLKGHFLRNVIAVTDIHMYHTLDNTLDSLIAL